MRIAFFEHRAKDIMERRLLEGGAEILAVPLLFEKPIIEKKELLNYLKYWNYNKPDYFIFLNGSGIQYILDALESQIYKDEFFANIKKAKVIVRGPKPAGILERNGITHYYMIPEPYISKQILDFFSEIDLKEKKIVIQHYGRKNQFLSHSLQTCGAEIIDIIPYKWELPENHDEVNLFFDKLINQQIDIVVFTNSIQVEHLFELAKLYKTYDSVINSFNKIPTISIGPLCTQALKDAGIPVKYEVRPSKLYALIDFLLNQLSN